MTWSPPPQLEYQPRVFFFILFLFIYFLKISAQELLNPPRQLLEIHQENSGKPPSPAIAPGNPIPLGRDRRSRGRYAPQQHTTLQKPSCSYDLGNGAEGPSPSSTHLDRICGISSSASPDGQMPETSSGVVCWRRCRRVS